jgi:hypothetical protein
MGPETGRKRGKDRVQGTEEQGPGNREQKGRGLGHLADRAHSERTVTWRPGQLPIGQTAKARSGYRVQSLRNGRDRQCRTHPIHAVSSELVKIALSFYIAGGFDEKRGTPSAKMTSLRMMAPPRKQGVAGFRSEA